MFANGAKNIVHDFLNIKLLSCKCGEYAEILIMPEDGRWDLTGRLKC